METVVLLVLGVTIVGFGLVSERISGWPLTGPMIFTAIGAGLAVVFGAEFPELAQHSDEAISLMASLTLMIVLFSDASRIDARALKRDHDVPVRLLMVGLPLAMLLGSAAALLLYPGIGWAAAVMGVLLAPTDAALGQAVIENHSVPRRIRQALNVESGLNDGIALPALLLVLGLAAGVTQDPATAAKFAALQLGVGPLFGLFVGWAGATVVDAAANRGWISEPFERLVAVGLALCAFAGAEVLGGNGFIAAFCGGLAAGNTSHACRVKIQEFSNAQGQMFVMLTFVAFGALLLPRAMQAWTPVDFGYACLSLFVVRPLSVAVATAGKGLRLETTLFLGWFGPRGVATVLYALVIVERAPGVSTVVINCAMLVVLMSLVLHGISAAPWARGYGRRDAALAENGRAA